MRLQRGGVLTQELVALGARQVVGLGLEEGHHGRLGVDDEVLAPGELDHDVGAHLAPVPAHAAHLLVEVAPGQQAGVLEHAAQLHLAPRAAHRRGVEGAGEALRLAVERRGRGLHLGDGPLERRELVGAVALERADLLLDPAERVAQRREGGGRLGVVGQRRLEVDHPLAQQVPLRGDARRTHGTDLAHDEGGDCGAEDEAYEKADDEFHAADHASHLRQRAVGWLPCPPRSPPCATATSCSGPGRHSRCRGHPPAARRES